MAVLAVHAPPGARVLWGECRQSGGTTRLHAYPDLDVLQVVDPETGEHTPGGGELVLTQLGMRGSALLRWRTGDVVAAVTTAPCPSCGPSCRAPKGLQRDALVTGIGATGEAIDLRAVASALSGRQDIRDWRIIVGRRAATAASRVVVRLVPGGGDAAGVVIGAAADIRALAGAPADPDRRSRTRTSSPACAGSGDSERILVE